MRRRKQGCRNDNDNGFSEWGGYMEAKKAKLQAQFKTDAAKESTSDSCNIFKGIAIFVNGYSVPSADELKLLMMKHGGIYHHYYRTGKTTHIIATNLPDTKVKQLKNMNVVKPDWIVESIAAGKLLDYHQYLLYSHQSKTQPKLIFKKTDVANKPSTEQGGAEENTSESTTQNNTSQEIDKNSDSGSSFCLRLHDGGQIVTVDENESHAEEVELKSKNVCNTHGSHHIKTASEAGFLSEFYSNSRLHHISTMGAVFKQYVNGLREKCPVIFPGVEKLKMWKQHQGNNTPAPKYKTVIMHIDMDCFFVSVGLRRRPDLKGFPVAVTHAKSGGEAHGTHRAGVNRKAEFELYKIRKEEKSKAKKAHSVEEEDAKPWSDWVHAIDESNSMSEIASCNYEARKLGLKNGMFLGQALKLCPNLKTIPYDFEGYKEVSYCLYDTVASYTVDMEAVSCDELFVDCTSVLNETGTSPLELASALRSEIREKTGCPCSAGFGSNRLQARLATKRAKPDGQFYLEPSAVQFFMEDIPICDLPGVGRSTSYKLSLLGLKTCLDLQQISLSKLQADFGVKNGDSLYKHCRGQDPRKLVFEQVRKSVSAEVNYGIRFQNTKEAEKFIQELTREVHNRLQEVNMKTKFVTLKLMIRAKDAPVESAKFLGHGVCDHISRSSSLQSAVSDIDSITREVMSLNKQLNVEPTELRGIGIHLSRLESAKSSKPTANAIDKFLCSKTGITKMVEKNAKVTELSAAAGRREDQSSSSSRIDTFFAIKKKLPNQVKENRMKTLKPMEIDKSVLAALPEDIRQEVMLEYGLGHQDGGEGPSTVLEPDIRPAYSCDISYSQIDQNVLNELPSEIKEEIISSVNMKRGNLAQENVEIVSAGVENIAQEIKSEYSSNCEEPRLDRSIPLSEIRSLIKAWTASEDCPQRCDVAMLADYMEGLVVARQLDTLDICISCLHRCILKRQCVLWQEAYHSIVNSVQSVMLAVYGLHLLVPSFDCI